MPEKSVREMGALERRHYSLASRVWRSLITMSAILAVIAIAVGFVAHGYAVLNKELAVAYNYASSVVLLLDDEADIASLSEGAMSTYASLTPEQRDQVGTLEYRERFLNADNNSTYYRTLSILDKLEGNEGFDYVYLAMYDRDTCAVVYIADPDNNNRSEIGNWEAVDPQEVTAFLDWNGEGIPSYIGRSDRYGWMGTSGYPVRNEAGETVAFLLVDVSIRTIANGLKIYALQFSLVMFLVINLFAALITRHMRKSLVDPINRIAEAAETYIEDRKAGEAEGEHFSKLDIRTGDEIENLSLVMADMEHGLVEYEDNLKRITSEKQRIGTELHLAQSIQASMLPNTFPPFPDRTEFDIYASMNPAKEVGGDFYDFFMVDEHHLAMVIADVSGKGIPAALYMMMTKILISDHALQGGTPAEVLAAVNRVVCANNAIDMFVTAWLGILDTRTGTIVASNAGHEYPAVRNSSKRFSLLKDRHGFVLGGTEDAVYRDYKIQLEPGDCVFVYTDGVTEAMNASRKLYGTDRLLKALNTYPDGTSNDVSDEVLIDLGRFMGDAPQYDDITLLCLHYRGMQTDRSEEKHMAEMTIEATVENIPVVTDFVNEHLEALDCPIKAQTQIDIAIDELFGNIAHYAYSPETGPATVLVDVEDDPLSVIITFIDNGTPFDPLAKEDPDITLSAEERKIGGLGVFLVKQTMDDVSYEYKDGHNILRIKKTF